MDTGGACSKPLPRPGWVGNHIRATRHISAVEQNQSWENLGEYNVNPAPDVSVDYWVSGPTAGLGASGTDPHRTTVSVAIQTESVAATSVWHVRYSTCIITMGPL